MSMGETNRSGAHGGLPPEAPLSMESRAVRGALGGTLEGKRERATASERVARWITFGGAAALTGYGVHEMAGAVPYVESGWLAVLLVVLFAATFGWISLAAAGAVAGAVASVCTSAARGRRSSGGDVSLVAGGLMGRTALVMPVYNEDPAAPMAALAAMAKGLARLGAADAFEIFIASDTNRADAWSRETVAAAALRAELDGVMPVWYRRRPKNVARKSGNVEEFVRRFGGRYDAMVMLDADSVMAPETLVELSVKMRADPKLGLLQTVPRLVGATALLPRLQQWASRVYGRPIARGVAAWQGPDGNYWGHNAILRMEAFAGACGLPVLGGPGVFGGPILSHDFAEAAWMRRAGWSVRMDPDLGGSYEEGPPTLLDLCVRDRRWMQGNFQHAGIVGARGLSGVSRAHLLSGIAGYLMSPLWLALMVVGAVVAARTMGAEPRYFTQPFQLEPTWPRFDAARMLGLFWLSVGVLLVPKAIGLASETCGVLRAREARHLPGLWISAAIELVASALYAPVQMAMQSRQCLEILLGRDAGWSVQSRAGAATPWGLCVRRHLGHLSLGVLAAMLAWGQAPDLLPWLAPTLLGLVAAIPLSRLSGSRGASSVLGRLGLVRLPEEESVPEVLRERDRHLAALEASTAGPGGLRWLLARRGAADEHFALAGPRERDARGAPNLARLSALAKIKDARTLDELEGWLSSQEELAILSDHELFSWAASLPARLPVGEQSAAAAAADSRSRITSS